jgi:hypothetical protein
MSALASSRLRSAVLYRRWIAPDRERTRATAIVNRQLTPSIRAVSTKPSIPSMRQLQSTTAIRCIRRAQISPQLQRRHAQIPIGDLHNHTALTGARFCPLEVFGRQTRLRASTAVPERHPKTFTILDIPVLRLRYENIGQPSSSTRRMSGDAVADRSANRTHEAARVLRRRAIAPGRPRTFMIRPLVS